EGVLGTPERMELPVDVVARRRALYRSHPCLLLADPIELGDQEGLHDLEVHPPRRRDAHLPVGRRDHEADAADVLPRDVDGDVTDLELGRCHRAYSIRSAGTRLRPSLLLSGPSHRLDAWIGALPAARFHRSSTTPSR